MHSHIISVCNVYILYSEVTSVQILFIQMFFAISSGMYSGGWSLWAINRFKDETVIRYSGFGIAYNIALALFGGTSPLIATALVLKYDTWTLGIMLFCYGLVSVGTNIFCYFMIDKKYEPMETLSVELAMQATRPKDGGKECEDHQGSETQ